MECVRANHDTVHIESHYVRGLVKRAADMRPVRAIPDRNNVTGCEGLATSAYERLGTVRVHDPDIRHHAPCAKLETKLVVQSVRACTQILYRAPDNDTPPEHHTGIRLDPCINRPTR